MLQLDIPRDFRLTENFLAKYRDREPEWGAIGYVVFKRSYARPTCDCEDHPDCGHPLEEWWQTVRRVVEGTYAIQKWHCLTHHLVWSERKAQASAQTMFDLIFTFKFTPPGRGLWMMGTDYTFKRGSGALMNCAFRSTKDIDKDFAAPFVFLMDMLMLGCGVGFDCRGREKTTVQAPKQGTDVHVVPDTREGWIELMERYLYAYVGQDTVPGEVDYSLVRKEGEKIRGFGGTASGPGPLKELIASICQLLDGLAGEPITSSAIVDLGNFVGKCVVSGNVRRSAEIALSDHDDEDFRTVKDPTRLNELTAELAVVEADLRAHPADEELRLMASELQKKIDAHPLRSHRWASNNSIFAIQGMDYATHAASTASNGEPGYVWLDTVRSHGRLMDAPDRADSDVDGMNPCGEQPLVDGECCNLVETYPAHHDSYADYQRTLKWAYLYAKTVTLLPHHDPRTNAIMMHKRRIGLGQAGVVQAFAKHGRRTHFEWCDRGYRYVQDLDALYSKWLCVPRSSRTTTLKPGGTTPLLSGATPGVHYAPSEYYIRRVKFGTGSAILQACIDAGYPSEPSAYGDRAVVVEFPVRESYFEVGAGDVTLWEQMENAAQMQYCWSDNAVSCTVSFEEHEARDIKRALELYEGRLKGISFLPRAHGYAQPPYEPITRDEWAARCANLQPLVLEAPAHEITDRFCEGDRCEAPIRT